MKANVILIENYSEIQRAIIEVESKGFGEIPEEVLVVNDVLFNIDDVRLAFINQIGAIRILMHDDYYDIEYDRNLWNKLEAKFE